MSSNPEATRPDAIRRQNLAAVLAHVHRDGPLTRAELTQRLGLSRSTVGALLSDLTALGLLDTVVPSGGAGVGRPSHVVAPHPHGPFVVAVDIDVTHVTVAAVGIGGVVLARDVVPTAPDRRDPDAIAATIGEALPRLRARCAESPVAAVGVSVPGVVDRDTGLVRSAPNLGWEDVPLPELLATALPPGATLAVGNDADLAVLAELRRGSCRDCDDVVFLMARVGLGAGIVVNGVPMRGHDGYAGEVGHIVVDPKGPRCHCGRRGCVETYVGVPALLANTGHSGPVTEAATAAFHEEVRAGGAVTRKALQSAADPLGRAIAAVITMVNPQRIVLGGFLATLVEVAGPQLDKAVRRHTMRALRGTVDLVTPGLGADSALVGAAEVAFAELLSDPVAAGLSASSR